MFKLSRTHSLMSLDYKMLMRANLAKVRGPFKPPTCHPYDLIT